MWRVDTHVQPQANHACAHRHRPAGDADLRGLYQPALFEVDRVLVLTPRCFGKRAQDRTHLGGLAAVFDKQLQAVELPGRSVENGNRILPTRGSPQSSQVIV